jgi:hypothetical protein
MESIITVNHTINENIKHFINYQFYLMEEKYGGYSNLNWDQRMFMCYIYEFFMTGNHINDITFDEFYNFLEKHWEGLLI